MNEARQIIASILIVSFTVLQLTAQVTSGQRTGTSGSSNYQTEQLIRRAEHSAERLRMSLDDATRRDESFERAVSSNQENVFDALTDLERSIANLREHQQRGQTQSVNADVEAALGNTSRIDNLLSNNRLPTSVDRDWTALKTDINQLSRAYNVAWDPNRRDYPPYPPAEDNNYNYDRDITGTYRLNRTGSDDARSAADRATRSLPASERNRVYDQVMARLEAPEQIAIERRGNTVRLASSRVPQVTLEANGREQAESTPDGRTVRARATFYGDSLTVNARGDQGGGFTVTFEPMDSGRRLQVTRRITMEGLSNPVEARTVYDRTSEVARFDVYDSSRVRTGDDVGRATSGGDWVIPSGTMVTATLDQDLSTKTSRDGDRFTLTVRQPSQYAGATIEGTISQAKSSGRVTGRSEMTLNFDRIRMRNGRTSNFAGILESVRAEGGEDVKVDNEGAVKEGDSQTQKTVQRAAIGTAVGALIGAIAGGGKGAAIGAGVGAGGGAGSVYIQGKDELQLHRGTEVTIRASGPSGGTAQ